MKLSTEKKSSLDTNPKTRQKPMLLQFSLRRTAFCHLKGSMTVEASFALPIFIFFFANILSLFFMYRDYASKLSDLHKAVMPLAVAGYETGDIGGDTVELFANVDIKPLISYIGFPKSHTVPRLVARKWTGYNQGTDTGNEVEEYVYITQYGEVYHRSIGCSHLNIDIETVSYNQVKDRRNSNGGKYTPCEKCVNGVSTGIYFITSDGDRFHNSPSCSGLVRHIDVVPLSKVNGRRHCKRCGG